jgi:hypothetical protein
MMPTVLLAQVATHSLIPSLHSPYVSPIKRKVKGKIVPVLFLTEHHAMRAYWGSGGIATLIL